MFGKDIGLQMILSIVEKKLQAINPHELLVFIEQQFEAELSALRSVVDPKTGLNNVETIEADLKSAFALMHDALDRLIDARKVVK